MRMIKASEVAAKMDEIASSWQQGLKAKGEMQAIFRAGINCYWSYGISPEGNFCFFLESPIQIGCGHQLCTKSIQSSEFNEKKVWYLKLELMDIGDVSVFSKLMEDLVFESLKYNNDEQTVSAVVLRFNQWREMLSHVAEHKSEEKGLFGELYVLREILEILPPIDAVLAWMGPDYAVQDYKFANSWIEVKTVGSNAFIVRINSLSQLDNQNTGYLYVVKADLDEFDSDAESVKSIYSEIQLKLRHESPEAYQLFEDKLSEFKYKGFVTVEQSKFSVKGRSIYKVGEGFPILSNQVWQEGISSVVYELKLASLKRWEIS